MLSVKLWKWDVCEEKSNWGQHSILLLINELVMVKHLGQPENLLTPLG
jgi:hypothetical protein